MTVPSQTLSRPLAARVAGLPKPADELESAEVPDAVIRAAVQAMEEGHTHYTDRPGILASARASRCPTCAGPA